MSGDDFDTTQERDILYELFIYSEWVQEPELVTRFGYGSHPASGKSGLLSWFLPTPSISAPVLFHKTSYPPWQLSLSSDDRLVAVLKDNCAEIRGSRDDFVSVIATCQMPYDPQPQFRCVSWSTDTTLLAISSSTGRVVLFDLAGEILYAIDEDPLAKLEGGGFALVNMLWTEEKTKKTQWSYELITVAFNGQVRGYFVNSDTFSPTFQIYLPTTNGSIGATVYHPLYSLILIGGASCRSMETADVDDPSLVSGKAGISAYKILVEEPFLQKVETIYQDTSDYISSFAALFRSQAEDCVCSLSISPSGKQLLCLHSSGVASLWSLPGLILIKMWKSFELPSFKATNPHLLESEKLIQEKTKGFHNLLHVDWWSEDKMIIVRRCGSICVISTESGRNLLGENPEWFGVAPRLASMVNKGFLTIECEWQMGLSKPRANSSFIGSELENSFFSEDSDNEELQMQPSWFGKLISMSVVRRVLEYVTDTNLEDVKPRRVVRIYRLLGLKSTTPQELFAVKINNGEYSEALDLANRYDLDADPVYQHQWRKTEPTKANIYSLLHKVKNKCWVLQECLQKLTNDPVSTRELLLYGLRVTNIFAVRKTPADEIPQDVAEEENLQKHLIKTLNLDQMTLEQKWMIECRRKFLIYLDALQIYESFMDSFDPDQMAWFRQQSPLEAAVHFARKRKPEAVVALLTFHTQELVKHWLPILNQFPETSNPSQYAKLLPYTSSKPPYRIRHWQAVHIRTEVDWAENLMKVCPFAEQWEAAEREFYEANPDCVEWKSGKTLEVDFVAKWYISRIRAIEANTLLTDNALELVRLAYQKLRIQDGLASQLTKLKDDLITVEVLTVECNTEGASLKNIEHKTLEEQLKMIMANATESNYLVCVRQLLIPFVERCERSSSGAKFLLLKSYFAEVAQNHLGRVVQVWQFLREELNEDLIAGDIGNQIDFCIACCEANKKPSQLQHAPSLLNFLPSKPVSTTARLDDLFEQLESLKRHLAVLQFLSDQGTHLTIAQSKSLREDPEEAYRILQETFLRLAKKSLPREEWLTISSKVFGSIREELSLDLDRCTELLCDALIGSMNRDNIYTSGCMLNLRTRQPEPVFSHRLNEEKSLRIVLKAARGYFDSATSYSDQCIGLAKSCLALIQDVGGGEVQKELDLIESLPLLEKFGIQMLPVHVRSRDKLTLIREVAIANRTNFKNFNKINQLAQYLGILDEDASNEGLILSFVAEIALKERDYRVALNLCQRIMQGKHVNGWKACARLGSCEEFKDFQERRNLLGFCVTFAPSQHLKTFLNELNNVELQEYYGQLEQKFSQKQDTPLADAKNLVKNIIKPNSWLGSVTETVKGLTIRNSSTKQTCIDNDDNERFSMAVVSLSPFYSGLWGERTIESRFELDFKSFQTEMSDLPEIGTVLHYASVSDRNNETKSASAINDDMLLSLSQQYMVEDVYLALCLLLHLNDPEKAEKLFLENLAYAKSCLQIGSYFFALACIRTEANHGNHIDGEILVAMPREELIARLSSMDFNCQQAADFKDLVLKFVQLESDLFQAQLAQEQSGGTVDVGRFAHDEIYKKETILGMAYCDDLQTLRVALNLARHYDVSQFEVCFGHLEHLFINSTHAPTIEERLQQENLLEILTQDKENFKKLLQQRVFTILIGTNYDHMSIYYGLMKRCSKNELEKKKAEAYLALLKDVDENLDGIDFKRLTSSDAVEQRKSLTDIVDIDNIDDIAKICGRFKSILRAISRSTVIQVFLKNEFVAAGNYPKEKLKDLFKEHLKYVGYLSSNDTVEFIKDVCFDPLIGRTKLSRPHRLEIIKIFLAFAKHKAKLPKKAEAPETSLSWDEVQKSMSAYLRHLQKIEDGFMGELLDCSQNPALEGYIEMFEMTAGEKDQLITLLTNCTLSECDPALLESLLSICPASEVNLKPSDLFLKATEVTLERLRTEDGKGRASLYSEPEYSEKTPLAFQTRKPITIMRRLLTTGKKITENRATFDRAIVELLRHFCLDKELQLSTRLTVLRLLKDNACAVNEEDEVLLLHLETMALLQETWPNVSVAQSDTETSQGRESVFNRLLDASSSQEQFDTLCTLLTSWPPFYSRPSPWFQLLMKMSKVPTANGLKLLSVHRMHPCLCLEECIAIEKAWSPLLLPQERILFLLETEHCELHEKAIASTDDQEISEAIRDRILQLNLAAPLVHTSHHVLLMDRLLERDDFQTMFDSVSKTFVASGFLPEAASLSVVTDGIPKALQTFSESLSYFVSNKKGS